MAVGVGCQITDLTVNDHACLTFGDGEELFDLTAAFVRDGLSGGLKVVWLSEAGPGQATAELERRGIAVEPALAAGQMAAAGSEGRLLSGQAFSASRALGWLGGQMAACRREGFPGLRVAVDMSWALRPVAGVEQLPDFEEGIAAALAGTAASVLCQYDRAAVRPGDAGDGDGVPYPVGGGGDLPCGRGAADLPAVRAAGDPAGRERSTTRARSRWRWHWRRRSGSRVTSR